MAQAGYTPISLYYSTTASAAPDASNLVAGELALNTLDEKLYFKNSAGTVKLLASSASTTNVQTISFGTTGLTPSTATSGAVTVAGTLAVANGGTGIVSFGTGVAGALGQNVSGSGSIALTTSPVFTTPNLGTPSAVTLTNASGLPLSTGVTGTLPITSGGTGQTTALAAYNALSPMTTLGDMEYEGAGSSALRLAIGTTGQVLTVAGGIPSWATPASGGVTTISFGSTGLTPSTATSGAVSVAGTLAVANGGTGVTTSTGSGANVLATSPTLVTPVLGTPSSGTLTSCTGLPLSTGVTGTLGVANGGTGLTATPTNGQIPIGNGTGFTLATLTQGTGITIANTSGAITISSSGGSGTGTPPINRFYTTSATYTPTANMKYVVVSVGGGGGGNGGNTANASNGGAGGNGGVSTFGSLLTGNGGNGGQGARQININTAGGGNAGNAGNASYGAGATAYQAANTGQNTNSILGALTYSGGVASAGSAGSATEYQGNGGNGGQGGFATALVQATTIGASVAVTPGAAGNAGNAGGGGGGNAGSAGAVGFVRITEFFG